eukprot:s3421_g4.t1
METQDATVSPPMTPVESHKTADAVMSVGSRKKSTTGAQIHGDFIRAKTVKDSGEFHSIDSCQKFRRWAKRLTTNPYVQQCMALVVLFDAYCNCPLATMMAASPMSLEKL